MKTAVNAPLWRGWSKYDDHEFSAERWFAEAAALGYQGVELGGCHELIGEPAQTRALCAEHGLEIAAYAAGTTWNPFEPAIEKYQRDIRYAHELGVTTLMCCGGFIPSPRRTTYPADYDMFASSIGPMVAFAADHGCEVAYHPHRGACVETIAETRAIIERVPEVKLCVDIAHLEAVGESALRFIQEFGERIIYTHIKDYRWDGDTFCELGQGDGDLDVAACLAELRRQGYDGWLTFELDKKWDGDQPSAQDSAARALASMTEAWEAAGAAT